MNTHLSYTKTTVRGDCAVVALAVECVFGAAGLIPHVRKALTVQTTIQWNYTTVLKIIFGLLSAGLLIRFFKAGGVRMLE